MTNSKHEIRTPADLQGLKLRLPQSEVMLAGFKALGADVAPLAFPELYGALQSGKFDGQENPIATIQSAKFDQVQKYLTVSGHVYDPALIVMSKDAFEDLGEGEKEAIVESAKVGAAASRQYAADAEAKGVAALQQAGMTVTTEIDRDKFVEAMAPANPEFEKRFGAEVIAQLRDAK
jgi:TRAP-type C4-dicarboxylate transport system substrate-binding protein